VILLHRPGKRTSALRLRSRGSLALSHFRRNEAADDAQRHPFLRVESVNPAPVNEP
jgi:hypothetical protein